MIDKIKVEKIMSDLYLYNKLKSDLKNKGEYDELRNNIFTYMESLTREEIIDICSLMELGRNCEINDYEYKKIRENCNEIHKNDKDSSIINYLITKIQLSEYLKKSLDIYPQKDFLF